MIDRLASGSEGLDAALCGGLPLHSITLVIGSPGSGKTILAQQYLFHNASADRPALYLSTVSEPLEKILRYGQSLDYFDSSALGSSVFYEDIGQTLNDDGLPGVLEHITRLIKQRRPGVMVIDSFRALQVYAADAGAFRRFLHGLAGRLSAMPINSFWVGEYEGAEVSDAPEFAVADAIVSLSTDRTAERELRVLQVVKLRGSGFQPGKHAYRLSPRGITVFPRLADSSDVSSYGQTSERVSSGVGPLDTMLSDGLWRGSSTMVAGPSGVGKTLLALHFAFAGAQRGEIGLIATLQENPIQLERILRSFSWSLDDAGIELMYRSPVDLYLDEWVYDLLDKLKRTGATRLVIDSLGELRSACTDELRFREFIYSLLQRCTRENISVIMTQEVPDLFGIGRLSEIGTSHLSDNVIVLQFVHDESKVKRAITVLKTRGSDHDQHVRQFDITSEGIVFGGQFASGQDLR